MRDYIEARITSLSPELFGLPCDLIFSCPLAFWEAEEGLELFFSVACFSMLLCCPVTCFVISDVLPFCLQNIVSPGLPNSTHAQSKSWILPIYYFPPLESLKTC
jgi:hypothetical protein